MLWGALASHFSLSLALSAAAGVLLAGIGLTWRLRLPVTPAADIAPSLHWPAPILDDSLDRERGPVMVTLEYDIAPEHGPAFRQAMQAVGAMRRRNGAFSWALLQDSAEPRRWQEFFCDESCWNTCATTTASPRANSAWKRRARQYQTPGVPVAIRHLLGGA